MVARWVLMIALGISTLGCAEQTVPEELIHVWRTRLPAYRDRSFEVRADSIIFGTGGYSTVGHRIEGVEVEESADGSFLCTLYYLTRDGGRTQVRLAFEPGSPDRLRFENRVEVWLREEDASWLANRG